MLKYLLGVFAALMVLLIARYVFKSVKSTHVNQHIWKTVAHKLRGLLSFSLPVVLAVLIATLNFSFLRSFLYSVLSDTMVSMIVSLLKIVFGTHSVMYSLQLLGVYAFVSSSILCAVVLAVNFLAFMIFVVLSFTKIASYNKEFDLRGENHISHTFLTLGQLRI